MSENVKIENKKTEGKDLTAEIKNLVVEFRTDYGVVQALNGLDLEIGRGKTLGLVGETGAGKTTTGLSLLRLIPAPPGVIVDGSIKLDGQDILSMSEKEMQDIRGKKVAMIFQDPMTSLNPVTRVGDQIAEVILLHNKISKAEARKRAMEMLEQVVARKQTTALMIITCETLRDTAGVLKEAQREILLLTLVEKLKSVLSPRMILAQISGYDFAVIANGVQEPWHAITLGQQVLTIMSERLPIERIQLRPHCSIGVAMFYGDLTAEQLYSRAISAAFTARHKGKNQIQFFDPLQMEAAQKRLTEESDILNALENHQFAIWLQPQVEMTSGKLVSAEVLLRIQQPDGSWDLPDGLIDRIECCGLMVTVGHWVLEESCRLLAAWQERGIMLPLSVNLSALQLMHPNMVADMLELLTRYRIQPGTLILEVTESRRIDDPHAAVAILRPLRNAGVRVALDDFGMGYAGLRQLQHMKSLPIDVLKIDKMFVEGLPEDSSMIAAIIMLAQSLNLQMIAEGVETEAQRDWLAKAGVGIAQGFLFARPLPIEIFEESYLEEK